MLADAWSAVAELGAAQHGVFTRSQASSNGVDRRRVATAVRHGLVTPLGTEVMAFSSSADTWHRRMMAVALSYDGLVASHRSAAALHRLDGCPPGPPEVSMLTDRRWTSRPSGIIVHRSVALDASDRLRIAGIPCTTVARTLADLGSVASPDVVLRALIGVLQRGASRRWITETAQRLHRSGQRGTGVLLRHLSALDRAGGVPESWLEEVLRRILEHPSLPPLVTQHELRGPDGRVLARFDHAFPSVKLAVEGHSRRFHFGPQAEALDADRDLRVARQGWDITYLGWFQAKRPGEVVAAIVDIVNERRRLGDLVA